MLQVRKLHIAMKKDLRELVRDFTFALNPGDKAAIIGEEGNGKSTLLKLIYDENLVEGYAEWSGTIQKDGMILGYLSQELPEEDRDKTAYEFCCGEEAFLDSSPKEVADAAAKLRFPADLFYSDRKMGTFSGGEKVKLRMALLTLRRPDCYLLDEPSNDLDIETLEWLESFIRECPQPVLYISHDEMLLENTANVIIHLEQLRRKTLPRYTVARMGYRRYVEERLSKFAHQEQVARKEREEERKRQEKLRKIEQKVQHQLDNIAYSDRDHVGKMLKKKMKSVKSMEHRFDREREDMTEFPDSEEAILVGFGPDTAVPGGKTVVDFTLPRLEAGGELLAQNIRLYVRGAEHVCIIGNNGAGKTTLLRQIAGELLPRRDLKAAYMPQDYGETVDQGQTPVEFLAKSGEKEELTRVKTYLGSMKYTPEEQGHSIAELSGGQKAKLFFLKMILDGANVLVLDEPTRNFSPLSGPVIRGILRDFPGCIISVSHDRRYIGEACGTLYRMTPGGLVEEENVWEEG
ncbi:MAG TPA: ATP-binding cassette domain-containing protein [Candidatus Acutalibacter stercorigallinarum]|nr:ATP-binding cassette domain-containing protein [Candidatus Acutalibacter stercorigallinarum]